MAKQPSTKQRSGKATAKAKASPAPARGVVKRAAPRGKPPTAKPRPPIPRTPVKHAPWTAASDVYAFVHEHGYTIDELAKLDGVHRAQVLLGARDYVGIRANDVRAAANVLALHSRIDPVEFTIDHYDIVATHEARPRYELWVFGANSGVVFVAGRPFAANVHLVDGEFQALVDDPELVRLAMALQAASQF
jgi:hypothetical protein